jgi:ABC-type Fe3+ transport system permease subunit
VAWEGDLRTQACRRNGVLVLAVFLALPSTSLALVWVLYYGKRAWINPAFFSFLVQHSWSARSERIWGRGGNNQEHNLVDF